MSEARPNGLVPGGAISAAVARAQTGEPVPEAVTLVQPQRRPDLAVTPGFTPSPAPSNHVADGIARARSQGVTWDQIGTYLAPKYEQARAQGVTIDQINKYLGITNPAPVLNAISNHLEDVYAKGNPTVDIAQVRGIYADAIREGRIQSARDFASSVIQRADQIFWAPYSAYKGALRGAAEAWGTGPSYEPAPANETRLQTLGRVLSMDLSAAGRAMAAGFAGFQGGVAGFGEGLGTPSLGRDIAGMPEAFMGSPGGMGAPGAFEASRYFPSPIDTLDNAVALQRSIKTEIAPGHTATVQSNLLQHWAETGEDPTLAMQRSLVDGALRDHLLTPQPPPPPAGSSTTPTPTGPFVIPKELPERTPEAAAAAPPAGKTVDEHLQDVLDEAHAKLTPEQNRRMTKINEEISDLARQDRTPAQQARIQQLAQERDSLIISYADARAEAERRYNAEQGAPAPAPTEAPGRPAEPPAASLILRRTSGGPQPIQTYSVRGPDGGELGVDIQIIKRGSTATVEDIAGPGAGYLGPRAVRAILNQYARENPDITEVDGLRTSGGRVAAGEAGVATIKINQPTEAPGHQAGGPPGRVIREDGNAADVLSSMSGLQGHDPRVKAFIENGGGDLDPKLNNWCAAVVNAALEQTGIKGSGSDAATSFLNWGESVRTAAAVAKGDVVVIARGREAGELGGHVGLATGETRETQHGTEIEMVSGNRTARGDVGTDWVPANEVEIRRGTDASTAQRMPDRLGLIERLERSADDAVSPAGAIGKYQITPDTARSYGFDPERLKEPGYNRMAAEAIDKDLHAKFPRTEDELVAWNAGPAAARKWIDGGRRWEDLKPETQAYLTRARESGVSTLAEAARERPGEVGAVGQIPAPAPKTPLEESEARIEATFGQEKEPNIFEASRETLKGIYGETFRPDHELNQLQERIEKGGPITDAENPRYLRRIAENADSAATYTIEKGMVDLKGNEVGPGLKQIITPVAAQERAFWNYAKARWAIEKEGAGKATGVNFGDALIVADAAPTRFKQAFDKLVEWQNGTLAMLRDSGFISKKDFARYVKENQSRIPGYRIDEEGERIGGGTGGPGGPIREFKGSEKQTVHPLKAMVQDAFVRTRLAQENVATKAMIDAAKQIGLAKKVRTIPTKFDLTPTELRALGAELGEDEATAAIWRRLGHDLRDDEIPVWRDGKMEAWQVFKDPQTGKIDYEVTRYLRHMDAPQLMMWQKMLRPQARFFRSMVVLNPLFPVRLMLYDIPWQFITKPGFRNTMADWLVGFGGIVRDSNEWNAYLRSGGAERVFQGLNKDAYVKAIMQGRENPAMARSAWNVVQTPLEKLQAFSQMVSNPLRGWNQLVTQPIKAGRYIRGVRGGESPEVAAYMASQAAFHRAGFGGPATRMLNQLHPFAAAYMNGLEQTVRSLFLGDRIMPNLKVWQTWAKASAIITVPTLANWALNHNEEWYKAAPDWQKDTGTLWMVGGHVIYVPFPPVMSVLFGGIPRRLLDDYYTGKGASIGDALRMAALSVAPSAGLLLAGNLFQPIIEHVANYAFLRGRPQVSQDTQRNVLPEAAASPYSTGLARSISRFLPEAFRAPPPVIDNYIQAWGGTIGMQAVRFADQLLHTGPYAGPNPPPAHLEDMPFLGSWLARYPNANAQPIQDFMSEMDRFEQVHGTLMRAAREGDMDELRRVTSSESPTAIALHFNRVRLNREEAAQFALHPDTAQYLAEQVQRAGTQANLPAAQVTLNADKAVKQLRQLAQTIHDAPTTAEVPILNEPSATEEPRQIGTTHGLSPTDKDQLLMRTYSWMQRISERGLDAVYKSR